MHTKMHCNNTLKSSNAMHNFCLGHMPSCPTNNSYDENIVASASCPHEGACGLLMCFDVIYCCTQSISWLPYKASHTSSCFIALPHTCSCLPHCLSQLIACSHLFPIHSPIILTLVCIASHLHACPHVLAPACTFLHLPTSVGCTSCPIYWVSLHQMYLSCLVSTEGAQRAAVMCAGSMTCGSSATAPPSQHTQQQQQQHKVLRLL
jgi:hypothetical protein